MNSAMKGANGVSNIEIDHQKARRLLFKLILMEKENNKTKQYNNQDMVKKIKKAIEEEVNCY
jgi:hypothetical protein